MVCFEIYGMNVLRAVNVKSKGAMPISTKPIPSVKELVDKTGEVGDEHGDTTDLIYCRVDNNCGINLYFQSQEFEENYFWANLSLDGAKSLRDALAFAIENEERQ